MSFSLIDVNTLQVLHLNLYKTFDLISLVNISLKRKSFLILLDDLKATFSLTLFHKIEICPVNVF